MIEVTEQQLRQWVQPKSDQKAFVSIYMPTHRRHPENQQDSIRFRNLAKSAVKQVRESEAFSEQAAETIERELARLTDNTAFWNHRADGLAWLYVDGVGQVFDFQRPVPERVVVGPSLHIKPLIRITQTSDRYHVLALTRHTARLFAGTRDALDEVENVEVPSTIQEALGEELTEPHLGAESYGGTQRAMFHGHGSRDEETDKDRDRFFRAVASAVETHWSNPTRLPLILVALDEYHAHFHRISSDRFLIENGVRKDPSSLSTEELRAATWEVMRDAFDRRLTEDIERWGNAQAKRQGSGVVSDVAREAANGRVELLLLEENVSLPGQIDWQTGAITQEGVEASEVDDALDDLAEMVLAHGGTVRIIRPDSLKTPSGIAAIYRY